MKWLLVVLAILLPALSAQPPAGLILHNGKIWTGDPEKPFAQAVACLGDRIVATGAGPDIRKLAGPATRTIDLDGRLLVPGFNDAHVHFYTGGSDLAGVQLRDAASESEFRDRIRRFAAGLPAGRWILGGNWDHENWTPARLPTRQLVDAAAGDHPVFVRRLDGHMALANTKALEMAGISRSTPDPPGGAIVRDASGEPTGVLKDTAMDAVDRVIPAPSHAEIVGALRAAMRHASERGVTSVQDMSASPEVLRGYQDLLRAGEMTVRVSAHQALESWQRLAAVGLQAGLGDPYLKLGGLKGFADGSLGSTTALFFEPYLDAPRTSGLEMADAAKILDWVMGADAAGLQVAIHAIGDKANHTILEIFRRAAERNGARDRRFRIEHAQHLRPDDISRFASQRVIASMQPYHAIDDGRWAEKRIGAVRAKGTYAFRSLLNAGATLAFGSDWYVAPLDPLLGIYAAVTRRTLDGRNPGGWVPEQKITVEEALRAYTLGSAYAAFDEASKGSIQPGKLADFAVLSEDILTIDPARIRDVRVDLTVAGGKVVFEREPDRGTARRDLLGVVDLHVHGDPDTMPRALDFLEAARLARARGMRAMLIKNHFEPTAALAYLVRQEVPGIEVFGGIVLNRAIGGVNPAAVERLPLVKGGYGRVVWMPTFDAGTVAIARNGVLLPAVLEVLDIVAKHGLTLATGHSAPAESLLLIREAQKRGVKRIIVTHPLLTSVKMSLAHMKEAAALGAKLEFVFNGAGKEFDLAAAARTIREVGPEHCFLSTDFGQTTNPLPTDGFAAYLSALAELGFTRRELDLMSKTNPASLLGLD